MQIASCCASMLAQTTPARNVGFCGGCVVFCRCVRVHILNCKHCVPKKKQRLRCVHGYIVCVRFLCTYTYLHAFRIVTKLFFYILNYLNAYGNIPGLELFLYSVKRTNSTFQHDLLNLYVYNFVEPGSLEVKN